MNAKIIDGREISKKTLNEIKVRIDKIKDKYDIKPGLAIIYIGDDEASNVYVKRIMKTCEKVGIYSNKYCLPKYTDEEKVLEVISDLNDDDKIHGIIIQLPLPKSISEDNIKKLIASGKDVDCIGPINIGNLYCGFDGFIPCTPKAALRLLKSTGVDLKGKNAVVVGRSNVVGRPIAELLLKENLAVTICHSKTEDIDSHIKNADVVVAAVGKPNIIKGDVIKEGAIIIDVGTNVVDGKLVGDVEYDNAIKRASYITPVPGGVGPMTNVMLIENTLEACIKKCGLEL